MIRVQLYLPQNLYQDIKLKAKREKKPAAQVIRDVLEVGLEEQKQPRQTLGQALQGLIDIGKKHNLTGQTNLSTRIDDYLYGDEA